MPLDKFFNALKTESFLSLPPATTLTFLMLYLSTIPRLVLYIFFLLTATIISDIFLLSASLSNVWANIGFPQSLMYGFSIFERILVPLPAAGTIAASFIISLRL